MIRRRSALGNFKLVQDRGSHCFIEAVMALLNGFSEVCHRGVIVIVGMLRLLY